MKDLLKLVNSVLFNESEAFLRDSLKKVLDSLNTRDKLIFLNYFDAHIEAEGIVAIQNQIINYYKSIQKNCYRLEGERKNSKETTEFNRVFLQNRDTEVPFLIDDIKNYIKRENIHLEYQKSLYKKDIKPLTSFKLLKSNFDKKLFYESLINKNYISSKTNFDDFKSIFACIDLSEVKPINWLGNETELLGLYRYLIEKSIIPTERYKKYIRLSLMFKDKNGNDFDIENWKSMFLNAFDTGPGLNELNQEKLEQIVDSSLT